VSVEPAGCSIESEGIPHSEADTTLRTICPSTGGSDHRPGRSDADNLAAGAEILSQAERRIAQPTADVQKALAGTKARL
jgi:hypothetical protein